MTKKDQIEEKSGKNSIELIKVKWIQSQNVSPLNMLITGFHSRTEFNSMRTCMLCKCMRVLMCLYERVQHHPDVIQSQTIFKNLV